MQAEAVAVREELGAMDAETSASPVEHALRDLGRALYRVIGVSAQYDECVDAPELLQELVARRTSFKAWFEGQRRMMQV